MRRLLVSHPAVPAAALLFSCALGCTEDDPAALFIDFNYQVRCIDCEPRSNDDPARDVHAVDGEDGLTLTCSAIDRGGDRLVSFSIEHTDPKTGGVDYSFSLDQANLDSSDPGAGCRVNVKEGSNSYEGNCTGKEATEDEPCIVKLEKAGDGVTGSLHCVHIPNKAQPTIQRYIVAGGKESAAKFEVTGCGL